jgi:probable HAF family extracellular repeat protein
MQNLGYLGNGNYAEARGVNGSSQVVGSSQTSLGGRAFLWTRKSGMQDLNLLIPVSSGILLSGAVSVNEAGQILAIGTPGHDPSNDRLMEMDDEHHAGPTHLYLLTPSGSGPDQ